MAATPVDPAKQGAAIVALTKALTDTFTPEQLRRVEQVKIQLMAARSRTSFDSNTFANSDIATLLELQPDQVATIDMSRTDLWQLQSIVWDLFFIDRWELIDPSFAGLGEKQAILIMAVLTNTQKAKWKELTGEPVRNLPVNLPRF